MPNQTPITEQETLDEIFADHRPEIADGIFRSRFVNDRKAVAIFERGGDNVGIMPAHVDKLERHPDYCQTLRELNIHLVS